MRAECVGGLRGALAGGGAWEGGEGEAGEPGGGEGAGFAAGERKENKVTMGKREGEVRTRRLRRRGESKGRISEMQSLAL